MTDHVVTLTVLLERDFRDDDAQEIVNAIKMVKGVSDVVPLVADPNTYWTRRDAMHEIEKKLFKVLRETE